MTPDIAAYAVSIAAFVALAIGTIVKPLIESIPFANPASKGYNSGAHDALIRCAVVALNIAGVIILCLANNQLTWANWFMIALQVGMQTLGSHAIYQGVKNTSSGASSDTATGVTSTTVVSSVSPAIPPIMPVDAQSVIAQAQAALAAIPATPTQS